MNKRFEEFNLKDLKTLEYIFEKRTVKKYYLKDDTMQRIKNATKEMEVQALSQAEATSQMKMADGSTQSLFGADD